MNYIIKFVQIINGDKMFNNYIIKNNTLYLDIDLNYEFGSIEKKQKNSIIDEIKNFINIKKIKKTFNKIIITCSGIVIGSIILLNNNNNITPNNIKYVPNLKDNINFTYSYDNDINISKDEVIDVIIDNETNIEKKQNIQNIEKKQNIQNIEKKQNIQNIENQNNYIENTVDNINKEMITINRSNGDIINIELEEYVIGVIAAEMPASFNIEALKAQSVLARTYALKAKAIGKTLTDTVSTQAYIDINQMRDKWGSSFETYYNKIKNATESTNGQYLTYNGNYIEALYHSTNNGKTESSLDVFGNYYPYLISVTSEFDKQANSYLREVTFDIDTFSNKLGIDFNSNNIIEILSYTDGSNIKEINIGGKIFSGKQVRELLGLRSADFDININENIINITTRGFGHGVGMSQYGANGMANSGYSYMEILSHYYPNTQLN